MMIPAIQTLIQRRALSAFLIVRKGVAAIEFALVAPIMIAFYFGMTEIALGISADRKVAHTASVAGDLAAQLSELSGDDVEDIMTAALAVINANALNVSGVTVELNSYEMVGRRINRIGYARMGPAIKAGGPVTFNPQTLVDKNPSKSMITPTSGAVVARVNFKYRPVTAIFLSEFTMHETFVLKPRKSASVPFNERRRSRFNCTASPDLSVSCRAY